MLIADDERCFARTLAEIVRTDGHEVVDVVHSGLEAIRAYRRHRPDVVLMDFAMDHLNGLTACRQILSGDPAGRIVFLSAASDDHALALEASGAVAVLQKPVVFAQLEQLLQETAVPRCAAAH